MIPVSCCYKLMLSYYIYIQSHRMPTHEGRILLLNWVRILLAEGALQPIQSEFFFFFFYRTFFEWQLFADLKYCYGNKKMTSTDATVCYSGQSKRYYSQYFFICLLLFISVQEILLLGFHVKSSINCYDCFSVGGRHACLMCRHKHL